MAVKPNILKRIFAFLFYSGSTKQYKVFFLLIFKDFFLCSKQAK